MPHYSKREFEPSDLSIRHAQRIDLLGHIPLVRARLCSRVGQRARVLVVTAPEVVVTEAAPEVAVTESPKRHIATKPSRAKP